MAFLKHGSPAGTMMVTSSILARLPVFKKEDRIVMGSRGGSIVSVSLVTASVLMDDEESPIEVPLAALNGVG